MGIISFGLALVAGRNRLPMPATGNTALVSFTIMFSRLSLCSLRRPSQLEQARLVQNRNSQFQGAIVLAPRVGPRDDVISLLRYRAAHLAASCFHQVARLFARHLG